jgi:predicted ATPase with chaperone activity
MIHQKSKKLVFAILECAGFIELRPLRAPHHTISDAVLVGAGSWKRTQWLLVQKS